MAPSRSRFAGGLVLAAALTSAAHGAPVSVSWDNSKPRLDTHGVIMDAHDGNIIGPIGGRYYLYAIAYGLYTEVGHVRPNGGGCAAHCSGCSAHCSGGCTATAPGVALCPGAPDQTKCDTTAGFRLDHNVSVWSSPTTASGSWRLETKMALAIYERPAAVYYRPKVQYNKRTGQYVLWINYQPGGFGSGGHYLTATSKTPAGPFAVVSGQEDIKMDPWNGNHGDFHYFVDDDENATAYIVYTVYGGPGGPGGHKGTTMTVQRLNADYTGTFINHSFATGGSPINPAATTNPDNGSSSIFPTDPKAGAPNNAESPSIFKWQGYYYVLSTHVCCFCRHGGGVSVFTAEHPLGPWSSRAYDVGCQGNSKGDKSYPYTIDVENCPSSVGYTTNNSATQSVSWSGAQQNGVHSIVTTSGPRLIWTGDRWYSADDALKGHDYQFWAALRWGPPDPHSDFPKAPTLLPLGNSTTFSLTLPAR